MGVLDRCPGRTLQDRWLHFEKNIWPGWLANENRLSPEHRWTWGVRVLVMARLVVPSWEWTRHVHLMKWIVRLSETDPLFQQYELLRNAVNELSWAADDFEDKSHQDWAAHLAHARVRLSERDNGCRPVQHPRGCQGRRHSRPCSLRARRVHPYAEARHNSQEPTGTSLPGPDGEYREGSRSAFEL